MPNRIMGVAFDMDGLMLDSERLTFKIFKQECKKLGYDCTEEIFKSLIGLRSYDTGVRLTKIFGEEFDYNTMYANNKREYFNYIENNGVPVKKGLFQLLDFLKENNIKACVATSTSTETATKLLKQANVYGYLDGLIGGEAVVNGKPAPDIYIKATEKMGISPQRCMGLEDSYNGLKAIHSAGLIAVMVPDMLPPTQETNAITYTVVKDLSQVINVIKEINQI